VYIKERRKNYKQEILSNDRTDWLPRDPNLFLFFPSIPPSSHTVGGKRGERERIGRGFFVKKRFGARKK
jgi:hypothetical protein